MAPVPLSRRAQHGSAALTAEQVLGATSLTRLSHRAPLRLLPMDPAATSKAGAAWCALGSFGGGLLGGDHGELDILVKKNATLNLCTQASTKIYRAKRDRVAAVQNLSAVVEPGGLLVVTPDPLVPFADAHFEQALTFDLRYKNEGGEDNDLASAVVVDWLGAGRIAGGERWAFETYTSRMEVSWTQEGSDPKVSPRLVEALTLQGYGSDEPSEVLLAASGMGSFDAAVTIIASGPRAKEVSARLQKTSTLLAARAGVRTRPCLVDTVAPVKLPELDGKLFMAVSPAPAQAIHRPPRKPDQPRLPDAADTVVARIVAERTDDIYRILYSCLLPLGQDIGLVPYVDRIHGKGGHPEPKVVERQGLKRRMPEKSSDESDATTEAPISAKQQAALMQLSDATLPTGGFAHSCGVEAASQLGFFNKLSISEDEAVRQFITVAALSTLRLQGPYVIAAHKLFAGGTTTGNLQAWSDLDLKLHSHLVSNAIACKASTQQGTALCRVLTYWLQASGKANVKLPRSGHMATSFGLATALLKLPPNVALRALSHCSVRDAVSAAVRLNLLGPLQAVEVQASIMENVLKETSKVAHTDVADAAQSAPWVETAHASHDILEARLFVT